MWGKPCYGVALEFLGGDDVGILEFRVNNIAEMMFHSDNVGIRFLMNCHINPLP